MSEPEIARRCPSCGASIRVRGSFCPQCGKPVPEQKSNPTRDKSVETTEVLDAAETVSIDLPGVVTADLTNEGTNHLTSTQAETLPLHSSTLHMETSVAEPAQEHARVAAPTQSSSAQKPATGARGAVKRARAARDVIEGDVLQGVGRLREISTVVLDEAAYDPSLRFVLIAVVLFVLFLLILILSEVMN